MGTGVVAMAICVAAFAMGQVGVGIAAVVVALLASAAGMAWLAAERRRVRDIERRQLAAGQAILRRVKPRRGCASTAGRRDPAASSQPRPRIAGIR
ncbi:hypothetical protein I552_6188 [Mycobacterium xenopi 3993]|nr:hypothetical protein I552_6188 [Mycobacterium xenopi 3993]